MNNLTANPLSKLPFPLHFIQMTSTCSRNVSDGTPWLFRRPRNRISGVESAVNGLRLDGCILCCAVIIAQDGRVKLN